MREVLNPSAQHLNRLPFEVGQEGIEYWPKSRPCVSFVLVISYFPKAHIGQKRDLSTCLQLRVAKGFSCQHFFNFCSSPVVPA